MTIFDRLTGRACHVLDFAQQESRHFNHNYIGTEHLLLGLVREGDGVAGQVLASFDVTLSNAREVVGTVDGEYREQINGQIGVTPRAKASLAAASETAQQLGHNYIETEHIFLGILDQSGCIALQVLRLLGVEAAALRMKIFQVMESSSIVHGLASPPAPIGMDGVIDWDEIYDPATSDQTILKLREFIDGASAQAKKFGQLQIGTEHLLLALVDSPDRRGALVLTALKVSTKRVPMAVEFIVGRGNAGASSTTTLTPRAKRCLNLALTNRDRLGHRNLGTHHLLLGLFEEGDGVAAGILESLGASRMRLEPMVIALSDAGRWDEPAHDVSDSGVELR